MSKTWQEVGLSAFRTEENLGVNLHLLVTRGQDPIHKLWNDYINKILKLAHVLALIMHPCQFFPYEDSKTVFVCPSVHTPRKEITLASSISVLH